MQIHDKPAPSAVLEDNSYTLTPTVEAHVKAAVRLLRAQRDPYVMAYLSAHGGHIPPAIYDSGQGGHHRGRRASGIGWQLVALQERHPLLVLVTINGGGHNPAALYNGKAQRWAKRRVKAVFGAEFEHVARVEYGPETGVHVHVVMPLTAYAEAAASGVRADDARLVNDVWGLARYLSKPADSRAALASHKRQVDPAELAAAVTLYLRERARRFRQSHREARAKGKAPTITTRLPGTHWASPGLPSAALALKAARRAERDQCVSVMAVSEHPIFSLPHGTETPQPVIYSKAA